MKVILFLLVAFAATPVVAQLKWDNPEQTFAPKPLEKLVIAKYRFTISELRRSPSMGCRYAANRPTEGPQTKLAGEAHGLVLVRPFEDSSTDFE
jgi:hypothetical protein